jgi:hypothetical protein
MHLTPASVAAERDRLRERAPQVVELANAVRADLGETFGADVDPITAEQYRQTIDDVFADGELAVNVAAIAGLLRDIDVDGDYPGFVVDELLGRELAGMIAGSQPLRMLGEATFHYADVRADSAAAGGDDLDAALAAGVQTRLPGWDWREQDPFGVPPGDCS